MIYLTRWNFLVFALAPVALMTGMILSTPVMATDTRTAIGMCDKNPNCQLHSATDGNNITMCMTGGPSKGQCVSCPAVNGACIVAAHSGPKGGKGKVPTVGIVGVLQPPSKGNPPRQVTPISTTGTTKGNGNQPVLLERTGNIQHSGGGGGKK